jgi:hypothetical protein
MDSVETNNSSISGPNKKNKILVIICLVLGVLSIGFGSYFFYNEFMKDNETEDNNKTDGNNNGNAGDNNNPDNNVSYNVVDDEDLISRIEKDIVVSPEIFIDMIDKNEKDLSSFSKVYMVLNALLRSENAKNKYGTGESKSEALIPSADVLEKAKQLFGEDTVISNSNFAEFSRYSFLDFENFGSCVNSKGKYESSTDSYVIGDEIFGYHGASNCSIKSGGYYKLPFLEKEIDKDNYKLTYYFVYVQPGKDNCSDDICVGAKTDEYEIFTDNSKTKLIQKYDELFEDSKLLELIRLNEEVKSVTILFEMNEDVIKTTNFEFK